MEKEEKELIIKIANDIVQPTKGREYTIEQSGAFKPEFTISEVLRSLTRLGYAVFRV